MDELFDLPLDEFTAARNALAKKLREQGDSDEAKQVAALKKPPVPSWAINQVVRAKRALAESLVEAGNLLRDAQKRVEAPAKAKDPKQQRKLEEAEKRRKEREVRLTEMRAELAEAQDEAADLERRAKNARRRADSIKEQIEGVERANR